MTVKGAPARSVAFVMPQIVYYVAASLDGYIADAAGGVDWLPPGGADDYGYADFYRSVDALAMGRRTYDQARAFGEWPYAGKPTYVFTRQAPDDAPQDVEFVREDPADFVRRIAAGCSGTLWLVGGANLAEQFRRAGLIDEYRVFVIPVILGQGVPLCGGDAPPTSLLLEAAHAYDDGVVMLRYHPAAG